MATQALKLSIKPLAGFVAGLVGKPNGVSIKIKTQKRRTIIVSAGMKPNRPGSYGNTTGPFKTLLKDQIQKSGDILSKALPRKRELRALNWQ